MEIQHIVKKHFIYSVALRYEYVVLVAAFQKRKIVVDGVGAALVPA